MKRISAVAILAMAVLWPLQVEAITGPEPEFRKLADDVYAYVGKLNDANALVVVTSQGAVVVDTGNNAVDARLMQQRIQALTNQPVRYVIITQNHGDHAGGTALWSPPATLILHKRVAEQWAAWPQRLVNVWRKRFSEKTASLQNARPMDNVVTFNESMTLHLGGKTIELIYVDDEYNPGDIAVWLPESGVMHGGFAAYKERHPDMRPDYSHGTTWGMIKYLEALIPLQPKFVIMSHGPVGDAKDLQTMVDYLVTARRRVRGMMDRGMPLAAIRELFHMNEYLEWDRTVHLPVMAAALHRELQGLGPEIVAGEELEVRGKITDSGNEGRVIQVTAENGEELELRISNSADIEGVPDRSHFRLGMSLRVLYSKLPEWNEALEVRVEP